MYRAVGFQIIHSIRQIQDSAKSSKEKVQSHFENLRTLIQEALTVRMTQLCEEIELIKTNSIQPLQQCEDLINEAIVAATTVMEQGGLNAGSISVFQVRRANMDNLGVIFLILPYKHTL